MNGLCILGSTGSIGTQTLEIVEANRERFDVISLSAGKNLELLKTQIAKFHPRRVCVQEKSALSALEKEFPGIEFYSGEEGLSACVDASGVHTVVVGIVGFAALSPTLTAIRSKKRIALANKESLVVAGSLLKAELSASGAECIPVDSEHNAVFQLLEGRNRQQVRSIVLTASGGPFWSQRDLDLSTVTPAMAVKHPNWKMGPKISVDSATLMNKGLEVIEAHYLFDFPSDQIEVWVHPQSIVHGALWFEDNTCLTQLCRPNMKSSIGYALDYPNRVADVIPKLSLAEMSKLEFLEPDTNRFPCLAIAREALLEGPAALIALNAANEIAVEAFLSGRVTFTAIPRVIRQTLDKTPSVGPRNLSDIFEADRVARVTAEAQVLAIS